MNRVIHRQHIYRRASNRRAALDRRSDQAKVIFPNVIARIKEAAQLSGYRIEAGRIRPLVQIAV